MPGHESTVRQLSTAALGIWVIVVLVPAATLALMLGPWAALVTGIALVAGSAAARPPAHLRVPRLLVGTAGLLACLYSLFLLAMR